MTVATLPPLQAQTTLPTPLGRVLLAATARGLAGLWFEAQSHHPGPLDAPEDPEHPQLARARAALAEYFNGRPHALKRLPVDLAGTAFQRDVWHALRQLRPGQTCSYGELAAQLGRASAVRAVGAAVGRNPLSIVVPCHRVLGAGGALTGYAGGLPRKEALLRLEGAVWH